MSRLLIVFSLLNFFHFFSFSSLSAQDVNKAMEYFQAGKYEQAALEFEKSLPAIENAYGAKDTNIYSKILIYTAFSFERNKQNIEAIQYLSKAKEVYVAAASTKCSEYISVVNHLADLYHDSGDKNTTEALYKELLDVSKKIYGSKHSEYVMYLIKLGDYYESEGNHISAIPFYLEVKNIRKEVLGDKNPDYENILDKLIKTYKALLYYKEAVSFVIEIQNIQKMALGEKHLNYAYTLNYLAGLYKDMGNYAQSESLYIEAKNIYKETLGIKHIYYATAIGNLASLYTVMNKYILAEPLYLEALKIRKDSLGEKHPDYASSLGNLGNLYQSMGNYSAAESYSYEAMKIRKEVLGEKHSDYATSLNSIAVLYNSMGNYTAAKPLYIEAKNIWKEVLGEKHPDYASSVCNLAGLYKNTGDYNLAESLYFEAMNIRKEVLGIKHPDYALSLNNLAELYHTIGNLTAAEPLYTDAKNIYKEVLGEMHPEYARALNNLATLYEFMGKYTEAIPLYNEALNIFKTVLGIKHPDYATTLTLLALNKKFLGNYSEVESLYVEAINIYKEILGEKHPDYALSLNNLAAFFVNTGNFKSAEPLYIEARNIWKEVLGEKHPLYATSLINLASLYKKMNRNNDAEVLYLEGLKIINYGINQNFAFLSEKEKEMYFKTKASDFEDFNSFAILRKTEKNDITKIVFDNVVRNKGLLLKSSSAMRSAILNSKDTSMINKYGKWISLKKEISLLYSTEINKRIKNPEQVEQQANVIEKDLVKGSQIFSDFDKINNITWEKIKNSLKPDEAAIEFIRFPDLRKKDTTVYCAMLIKPESPQPEMIQLFYENDLEFILGTSNRNNLSYIKSIYGTNQNTSERLYKLIWKPLEKYLDNIKTIYYSPDGLLHKISFSAIGKGRDMFLCDKYFLNRLSSTGKIVLPEKYILNKNIAIGIYGGIEYSTDTTALSAWKYLPGTKNETEKIVQVFKEKKIKTTYIFGKSATEESFKKLFTSTATIPSNRKLSTANGKPLTANRQPPTPNSQPPTSPSILHIATHGFFYPDQEELKKAREKEMDLLGISTRGGGCGFGEIQFVKNKNPLMRSGLVLAGANNVWNQKFAGDGEDGVLTALEVSQLDLQKTQLVVLSACETGLGDIKGSEGVYGLQRAFKMAGVKFLVMSLWQVPDKETSEFMELFYKKLLFTKDIRKSFNESQYEMRKKYDPFYWAAFVLIE